MISIRTFLLFPSVIVSVLLLIFSPNELDINFMTILFVNLVVSLLIFSEFLISRFKSINLISLVFLFLIGYFIVNFQVPLTYLFNFDPAFEYFNYWYWGDLKVASYSLSISSCAIIFFFLSYMIFYDRRILERKSKVNIPKSNYFALILVCYLFYILFFINSGTYLLGAYDFTTASSTSSYFLSFFDICLKLLILLQTYKFFHAKNKNIPLISYIKSFNPFVVFITFWHIFFSIYVGDRGPVITYLLIFFVPILIFKFKGFYKQLSLLLVFLIGSIFLSYIGEIRTRDINDSYLDRFSTSSIDSRYGYYDTENIIFNSTIELALSGRCLNHAIVNVPSKLDYTYGYFQFQHLTSSIPFLSGIMLNYVFDYDSRFDGTANLITYFIQGKNPNYGDGTSINADLYLDFGFYGPIVGLFLLGLFFSHWDKILISNSKVTFINWIFIMIFFSGSIYLPRAAIGYFIQEIIQIYIVFFLIKNLK